MEDFLSKEVLEDHHLPVIKVSSFNFGVENYANVKISRVGGGRGTTPDKMENVDSNIL